MNSLEIANLVIQAKAQTSPHDFLVGKFAQAKSAHELAPSLAAYLTVFPHRKDWMPKTSMFAEAHLIYLQHCEDEAENFAVERLGIDPVVYRVRSGYRPTQSYGLGGVLDVNTQEMAAWRKKRGLGR